MWLRAFIGLVAKQAPPEPPAIGEPFELRIIGPGDPWTPPEVRVYRLTVTDVRDGWVQYTYLDHQSDGWKPCLPLARFLSTFTRIDP